jgi:hypothetical protein
MKRLRARLTYANVVSTLALFLVLAGGTAFAAKQMVPKNSVGTKQIKNRAVTGSKIAPGSITGSDINTGTLGAVPDAKHASSADQANNARSADTAKSADSATKAADAQTLQGLSPSQIEAAAKLGCPSGTILVAGQCFEGAPRTGNSYMNALKACAEAGMVLPAVSEMNTFDLATNNSGPLEWAGQPYFDGTDELAEVVKKGAIGPEGIFANHPYRCAISPSN